MTEKPNLNVEIFAVSGGRAKSLRIDRNTTWGFSEAGDFDISAGLYGVNEESKLLVYRAEYSPESCVWKAISLVTFRLNHNEGYAYDKEADTFYKVSIEGTHQEIYKLYANNYHNQNLEWILFEDGEEKYILRFDADKDEYGELITMVAVKDRLYAYSPRYSSIFYIEPDLNTRTINFTKIDKGSTSNYSEIASALNISIEP